MLQQVTATLSYFVMKLKFKLGWMIHQVWKSSIVSGGVGRVYLEKYQNPYWYRSGGGCTLKNIKMQIGIRVPIGGGGPYPNFFQKFQK